MRIQPLPVLCAGHVVRSRYLVLQLLGQGGMGVVYLAEELDGTRRALKEIHLDAVSSTRRAAVIQQFRLEAQILTHLQHPNLPRVYDFFEEADRYYLVMDYIPGHNLEEHLNRQGALPEAQALRWLEQLCNVLDYLHSHRPPVIFRDLKPANVMVSDAGHIMLVDFGIAKIMDPEVPVGTLSSARGMVSPGYAAPEQYSGGTDVHTDIYALGATAYVLLTGRRPPDSLEVATGETRLEPVRLLRPEISERTASAVEWMMVCNRTERPASMSVVKSALGFGEGPATPAATGLATLFRPLLRRPAARPQGRRWPRLSRRTWACLAFFLLSLVALQIFQGLLHPAVVHFNATPPGTRVFVNGKERGRTPLVLRMRPGRTQLRFLAPGHAALDEALVLPPDRELDMVVQLRPGVPDETFNAEDKTWAYPPPAGPAPRAVRPANSERLLGVPFGLPPGWSLQTREENADRGRVVMSTGDGSSVPLQQATLSVARHVPGALSRQVWNARALAEATGWIVVSQQSTDASAYLLLENGLGPVRGRGFIALQRHGRDGLVQLTASIAPCQEGWYLVRLSDQLRQYFDFSF